MKIPERIETERLVLRKPRMEDAFILFTAYMQDPEVTRYTTWRPHRQLQEAEDFIRNSIAAWENGTRFPFVITLKEKDTRPKPHALLSIGLFNNQRFIASTPQPILRMLHHRRYWKRQAWCARDYYENTSFTQISAIYHAIAISTP